MTNSSAKDAVTSYVYSPVQSSTRNPWRPSPYHRFPWFGFGALLGALLGIALSVAILVGSDSQPTSKWTVQPTVYLAIASAITNITLHFALSEGVNVAWWRRATQDDTKISDLHRYWSHGNSLWAAITSGRHINLMAVACIFVAIGPINGPLLQRASRVTVDEVQQATDMSVRIAKALPAGYTGYVTGRGHTVALLTPSFTSVVNGANTQADINVTSRGCMGRCLTVVRGAGFAINCSTSTVPYNIEPLDASLNGTQAFGSYIHWGDLLPGTIFLGVQFKSTPNCDGNLQIRNCTMQAANVEYPVIIDGNRSTIEVDPATTMFDDKVYNTTDVVPDNYIGPSTYGGLYKALSDTYDSMGNLRWAGAIGYELITTGATVNRYAVFNESSVIDCGITFTDPSLDLIKAIRDMMFRTAIAAANDSDSQSVTAQENSTIPIYESHYLYLGLAILLTGLGWLTVVPTFIGWWHVGRTVSMSPIETAKAFRAPLLESADSNAEADALLKELGDRSVRYGSAATTGSQMERLEMSDPRLVRTPQKEQRFIG